jgi:hypothetical protein
MMKCSVPKALDQEKAMKFLVWMAAIWVGVTFLSPSVWGESKGHAWLHRRGNILLAGATSDLSLYPFDMGDYRAVGYNALWEGAASQTCFNFAAQYQIQWFVNGKEGPLNSPYIGGFIRFDEPNYLKLATSGQLGGQANPIGLHFINLMGMDVTAATLYGDSSHPDYTYAQYIQDFARNWIRCATGWTPHFIRRWRKFARVRWERGFLIGNMFRRTINRMI